MAIFIDCTLRDGSYVSKTNFTPKNVKRDFSIQDIILGINKIHSGDKKKVLKILGREYIQS